MLNIYLKSNFGCVTVVYIAIFFVFFVFFVFRGNSHVLGFFKYTVKHRHKYDNNNYGNNNRQSGFERMARCFLIFSFEFEFRGTCRTVATTYAASITHLFAVA